MTKSTLRSAHCIIISCIFAYFLGFLHIPLLCQSCQVFQACTTVHAAEEVSDIAEYRDKLFVLLYPRSFEIQKDVSGKALLLLKMKDSEYPTINVIFQPGVLLSPERGEAALQEDILQSYRGVGITDAAPVNSAFVQVSKRQAFVSSIRYVSQGVNIRSWVAVIPAGRGVLYLTLIDNASAAHLGDMLFESLLKGFVVLAPPQASDAESLKGGMSIFLIAGVLALFALLILYRRQRGR